MTRARLFDAPKRKLRWTGSRELVVIPPGTCPVDGSTLLEEKFGMAPLFRHGGFGAMLEVTRGVCPSCGWTLRRQIQEVRP